MTRLLEQAEQNVVNRAKAYADALAFVDALANFGNRACREHVGKQKFFQGLQLMREAIYAEQSEALRECFYLVGVGGDEAEEYSREIFGQVFNGSYNVLHFLDTWGHAPKSYRAKDREDFHRECVAAISKTE